MPLSEIEPLYTEVEAAKKLGIEFKWLRAERYAGRIGWKKVAGRAMYRHQDLVDWQKRGIPPCQEADQPANRASSLEREKVERRSGAFTGTMVNGREAVQRARAAAEKLIKSSRVGSSTKKTNNSDCPAAPVIPMKSR
ncbi:MAG: hypothetical protein JO081_17915 [Alphaproteobacteria bacterium]|nr:hypothetical protein [Alphaproteobacteria bacterium]